MKIPTTTILPLWRALIGLLLVVSIWLPLAFDLDQVHTADEKRWQADVTGFLQDLAHGRFGELLQKPHPGVTTQWFAASAVYSDSWTTRKLPLVISEGILILLAVYVAYRLWDAPRAIVLGLLLSLNPLLVAHMRVYAMDALLALFTILSLLLYLLWTKREGNHYLVLSGFAAAAAFLSKLPGILMVPFIGALLGWSGRRSLRQLSQYTTLFLLGFVIGSVLIMPSFLFNPLSVLGSMKELFLSDDYTQLHHGSPWYYGLTLLFFTTPLHISLLLFLPFIWPTLKNIERRQATILLVFAVFFVLVMSAGAKKGYRYILPAIATLDIVVALAYTSPTMLRRVPFRQVFKYRREFFASIIILSIIWQATLLIRLHPYTLAYVNPLTKWAFGERRLGWGEGLDLAAEYLNAKPNAQQLKVASYYPNEFAYTFKGETVPIHQWDSGSVDYAVAYRAMLERGPEAWETDVLNQLSEPPEHVITLGGLEYVWIYNLRDQ